MTLLFLIIFLDALPVGSWVGIGLGLAVTVLTFLVKNTFINITKDIAQNKKDVEELRSDLDEEKFDREVAFRAIDKVINELHVNILNKLEDIKEKFNDFRKQ